MKFVSPISKETEQKLNEIYKNSDTFRLRQRAHAILLSARGYKLEQLQDILQVDRDTLSVWIDRFEAKGIEGLSDLPRSGRPSIYDNEELLTFKEMVDKEPRKIKQAQAALQESTGKTSSLDTLKNGLKKS